MERLVAIFEVESPQGPLAPQAYAQALRGLLVQYGRRDSGAASTAGGWEGTIADLNRMEKQLMSVLDASIAYA